MDEKLEALLVQLERAQEKANERIKKLRHSLELKEFAPDAFDKGECKVRIQGYRFRKPQDAVFIITRGDGTENHYPLLDVPCHLWPKSMVETFTAEYYNSRRKQLDLAIAGKTVLLTVRT